MKKNSFNEKRSNSTSEENIFNIKKQFNKLAVSFPRKHRLPSVAKRHFYENEVWDHEVILYSLAIKQLTYLLQVATPT